MTWSETGRTWEDRLLRLGRWLARPTESSAPPSAQARLSSWAFTVAAALQVPAVVGQLPPHRWTDYAGAVSMVLFAGLAVTSWRRYRRLRRQQHPARQTGPTGSGSGSD